MKKLLLAVAFIVSVSATQAQSDKFTSAMDKNLSLFDSAKTPADFISVAAAFERIGDAEKNQWLPYYYAGLSLSMAGWMDQSMDKDANSTRIKSLCDKAAAINDNAEIYVVRNMAATQQMLVNPQERWMSYGQEATGDLDKGLQLDPNNPRLYYLQGMNLFNTPEQFGGGKDKAKPVLEKALALFKAEQPQPLYPHWGQKQTEDALAKCQ